MREDDGAGELFVVEPHGLLDALLDFGAFHLPALGCELRELAFGRVVGARALHPHAPRGLEALPGGIGEDHGAATLLLSAAQDARAVAGLHLLGLVGDELEVFLRDFFGVLEAGGLVVEREADSVEDGGLARARVARDGEEPGGAQGFAGEIYGLFALDGGEVAKDNLFNFHQFGFCGRVSRFR